MNRLRQLAERAAQVGRRALTPPRWVGWATRRLSKMFTSYCLVAIPALLVVADKEKLAAMHVAGALAGLLWWWAEYRIRAAWANGHRAGTRDALAVLSEAAAAVTTERERMSNGDL